MSSSFIALSVEQTPGKVFLDAELKSLILADSRGTGKQVHVAQWLYGGHLKQEVLFPFWTEPGTPDLTWLWQFGQWVVVQFLVATLLQSYCRYSAAHSSTALKERESGCEERRREEVFVGAHSPCRWWGAGSLVLFHWEREELLPSQTRWVLLSLKKIIWFYEIWKNKGDPSGVQMSLALCAICLGAGRDASKSPGNTVFSQTQRFLNFHNNIVLFS